MLLMNTDNENTPGIPEEPQEVSRFGTPNIPASIYSDLPEILKEACSVASNDMERDVLLLSSLGILSGCLPTVSGIYDRHKVYTNLYCYIIAPPASGKGLVDLPKNLAIPIHEMLLENSDLKNNKFDGDDDDGNEKNDVVPESLIIPGDCTATAFNELIANNKNGSIMVETEGTLLSERFRSSHGQFRTSFLKAAHHETISYRRRTNNEWKYIENPRISVVISSTPPQVKQLIPTISDGLASRFLFCFFDSEPVMKNVFSKGNFDADKFFRELGEDVLGFYNLLNGLNREVSFSLKKRQENYFMSTFKAWHDKFHILSGTDSLSVIRRLGLSHFRICMILTALRKMDSGNISRSMVCGDVDFHIAYEIINTLKEHSLSVFDGLIPRAKAINDLINLIGSNRVFFDSLPDKFSRITALKHAKDLISERTMDRLLKSSIFKRTDYGHYKKIDHV
jgi:hypothetical protein